MQTSSVGLFDLLSSRSFGFSSLIVLRSVCFFHVEGLVMEPSRHDGFDAMHQGLHGLRYVRMSGTHLFDRIPSY